VLSDLESVGYATGSTSVPACAQNAPHRRERLWVVAHARRAERGEDACTYRLDNLGHHGIPQRLEPSHAVGGALGEEAYVVCAVGHMAALAAFCRAMIDATTHDLG